MEKYAEIVKKRSAPGILIFDMNERLLYSNTVVFEIMPHVNNDETEATTPGIPLEVLALCRHVKRNIAVKTSTKGVGHESTVIEEGANGPCSLRAFHVGHNGEKKDPTHIVVLVERVVEKHEPDYDKAKVEYNVSKKELEVLKLVCRGFSNKEIGEKMFISVFTVKDHIKNLKRKMDASSRSELISLLK